MTAFPHTETATFRGGYEAPYNLLYLLEKLKKKEKAPEVRKSGISLY